MATLRDLLTRKGSEVISVQPTDTVLHVAELMNTRNVGGVAVLDGGKLAGIFTERDVLRRVVARGLDPATTRVSAVMTADVITCPPDLDVEECAALMTARRVRHLPVEEGGALKGIVTIGDLLAHQVREQQATLEHMHNYLHDLR
ncbi:MAG TPA: CBS domain-containing protein [Gemmatimonadales bacterium]|nr:CBS domain-containing protein [Gemmatimonadales bacterium]